MARIHVVVGAGHYHAWMARAKRDQHTTDALIMIVGLSLVLITIVLVSLGLD